jgi:hypothetical protein
MVERNSAQNVALLMFTWYSSGVRKQAPGGPKMNIKELAAKLNASEQQVENELEKRSLKAEQVSDAMLNSIGGSIHGSLAPVQNGTNLAPTSAKGKAQRAKAKADKSSAITASSKAAIATTQAAQPKPQQLEVIDAAATEVDLVGDVADELALALVQDANAIAKLMNPVERAIITLKGAQAISDRMTANHEANGLTVQTLIDAAIPKAKERKTPEDLLAAHMKTLEEAWA